MEGWKGGRVEGWKGGGWVGSHEVAGKGYVFTKTSQMASIRVIFTSIYHTQQLNPWPNSPASRVVNYSQLSLLVKGICSHLKVTRTLVDF